MNDITPATAIDADIATLEDLENLSIGDLLGGDTGDFNLSNNLPDCVVGVVIESYELKKMAAKPEEDKKARADLSIKLKVTHVFSCDDRDVDPETLVGRYHFENCPMLMDFGKARVIKMILGALGVKFTDKKAWAAIGGSFAELLAQLQAESVQFGVSIKTTERNGFTNTNVVDKQAAFISMVDYQEKVG